MLDLIIILQQLRYKLKRQDMRSSQNQSFIVHFSQQESSRQLYMSDSGVLQCEDGSVHNQLYVKNDEYEYLFQNMQSNLSLGKPCTCYIVSTKFICQWREYCLLYDDKPQLDPMNDDIFLNGKLKENLEFKIDYELLTEEIYQLFEPFGDTKHVNKRMIIFKRDTKTHKIYPCFLIKCNYLILTPLILRKIDCGYLEADDINYKTIQMIETEPVTQMLDQIIEQQQFNKGTTVKLWGKQTETSIAQIHSYLKQQLCTCIFSQYKVQNIGRLLKKLDKSLFQLNNGGQQLYFILELIKHNQKPILVERLQAKCKNCSLMKILTHPCPCGLVKYCSQSCLQKDKSNHFHVCPYAEEIEFNKRIDMTRHKTNLDGLVGLVNLGNTCYMNSSLQCLSNTIPLSQYFINSTFEDEINKKNITGSKGRIAKSYAQFIKAMYCLPINSFEPPNNSFNPLKLKRTIEKVNSTFAGYAQHDAQQFLSCLVDGLHQDLNRVQAKQPSEEIYTSNKSETDIAKLSWINYLKQNQSIITDLMSGQFRRITGCPDCRHRSIKFEPFNIVTLPIPEEKTFSFYVIYQNMYKKSLKSSFISSKNSPKEWMDKICQIMSANPKKWSLYAVSQKQNIYKLGRDSINEIIHKIENEYKNLFFIEKTSEEINIPKENLLQFTVLFSKNQRDKVQYLFLKIPILFNSLTTNGLQISKRVLKFIYNRTYKHRDQAKPPIRSEQTKQYQEYQSKFLTEQIFQIYLKFDKQLIRVLDKIQAKFNKEIQIKPGDNVFQLLKTQNINSSDCEIEVRFDSNKISDFNFLEIKRFQKSADSIHVRKDKNARLNGQIRFQSCIEAFQQPQVLMTDNQWHCPNCQQNRKAITQIKIYRSPKIIVFQLKRFKQRKGKKEKNSAFVKYPLQLDLTPFLIDKRPMQAYKNEIESQVYIKSKSSAIQFVSVNLESKPIYNLYAVCNHIGNLQEGHYTAFAKNKSNWYKFNDDYQPQKFQKDQIQTSDAYLLFYQRAQ